MTGPINKNKYSLDEIYSIINSLDSKTYVELAKAVKKKGACICSAEIVAKTMNEMGILDG